MTESEVIEALSECTKALDDIAKLLDSLERKHRQAALLART